MKPYLLLSFLFLLLSLLSCRDDFTLEADGMDLPVAYGFLDPGADDNYVRVQRTFLQSGGNAEELAAQAGTIYYAEDEATVVLIDEGTEQEFVLERVDARALGIEREPGLFATDPNVLYRTTGGVVAGRNVRLEIRRPGAETSVAETTILRPIEITRPTTMARIADPRTPLLVRWNIGENALLFDVRLTLNYRDINIANNTTVSRSIEFPAFTALQRTDRTERIARAEIETAEIYQFIGDQLEPIDNVIRRFDSFDVLVTAAGQEALDRQLLQNANVGITSSQALPRYSNLSNGLGLITSRVTALQRGITIDLQSQDSLRSGQYTRGLGFQ